MHSDDDRVTEKEIHAKGLTKAPRVTPQSIDATIVGEEYFTSATLTLCVLTLRNGFKVTGQGACASPENFDAALGRRLARDHAKNQIWQLEGYLLRQRLYDSAATMG